MAVDIVFETHSTGEDNQRGVATGWLPGALSAEGQPGWHYQLAADLCGL